MARELSLLVPLLGVLVGEGVVEFELVKPRSKFGLWPNIDPDIQLGGWYSWLTDLTWV